MSSLRNIHNCCRWRQAVIAPLLHDRAPALYRCLAAIRPLDLVLDDMGQRCLSQIAGNAGCIAAPVTKGAAKTMHACRALHSTLQ